MQSSGVELTYLENVGAKNKINQEKMKNIGLLPVSQLINKSKPTKETIKKD